MCLIIQIIQVKFERLFVKKFVLPFKLIFSNKQEPILVDFCCNIMSVSYLQYTLLIIFLLLSFTFFWYFLILYSCNVFLCDVQL